MCYGVVPRRPVESVGSFYDLAILGSYVPVIEQSDFIHRIVPVLPLLPAELHIRDYQYIGQRRAPPYPALLLTLVTAAVAI